MMDPAVPVAVGQLELVEPAGHPRVLVVLHEAIAEPNPRPSRLHRGVLPRQVLPIVPVSSLVTITSLLSLDSFLLPFSLDMSISSSV